MTPLAYRTVKDLLLPKKSRWLNDRANVVHRMDGIHCFDLFDAATLVDEVWLLAKEEKNRDILSQATFLPAPRTWLEGNLDEWGRAAIHLEQVGNVAKATLVHSPHDPDNSSSTRNYISYPVGEMSLMGDYAIRVTEESWGVVTDGLAMEDAKASGFDSRDEFLDAWHKLCHWNLSWATAALTIINSPKIVRRETHQPHKGLSRKIATHFGKSKPFQIRPWTEIKLEVTIPVETAEEGEMASESLTGKKALHFCRSHLRVRLGKLETVRSHWRGNASLGIVQSRYRVSPASNLTAIATAPSSDENAA